MKRRLDSLQLAPETLTFGVFTHLFELVLSKRNGLGRFKTSQSAAAPRYNLVDAFIAVKYIDLWRS